MAISWHPPPLEIYDAAFRERRCATQRSGTCALLAFPVPPTPIIGPEGTCACDLGRLGFGRAPKARPDELLLDGLFTRLPPPPPARPAQEVDGILRRGDAPSILTPRYGADAFHAGPPRRGYDSHRCFADRGTLLFL